jgi:hypothetical protein
MTGVPMDKYLAGPAIASQQAIASALAELIAPRDQAINSAFQQLAAKVQQLEAALGQVAVAAQQPKMTPFEVAIKTLTHFGDDEVDVPAKRCHDKAVALIERWLDAGLATSEAGAGEPGRADGTGEAEEAEASGRGEGDQHAPELDQAQEVAAENH